MLRPASAETALWLALLPLVLLISCAGPKDGSALRRIRAEVPDEVMGWRAADGGEIYDSESIFDYIDGHAEVYLAYGMQRCLARRYDGPDGEGGIVLDVFELASPADAYGVFTYDRDGEALDIGRDALYRYGWLSFWKDRLFVSVTAESESPAARAAVIALGESVATLIDGGGEPPALIAELPETDLDRGSIRFLHSQQILDTHLWLGGGDLFGLGPDTDLVLARYVRDGVSAHLILVAYPDADRASRAATAVAARLTEGEVAGEPVADGAGRWHALRSRGSRLAVVVGAATSELAGALIDDAMPAEGDG